MKKILLVVLIFSVFVGCFGEAPQSIVNNTNVSKEPINIDFYYGNGCPHCATTEDLFTVLSDDYELNIVSHEVYYDAAQYALMMSEYERFGYENNAGVPTTIIEGKTMIVGALREDQWRAVFDECQQNQCPEGIFTQGSLYV